MRKKIIKKVVAILTVVTLLIPNATQAYAADPVRGVQTNVDSSGLDKAVEDAKKAGVQVTQGNTEDKGTVDSKAAADAKRAEIAADYEKQIKKLNEAKVKMDEYNAKKAEYDKKKEKYDKDLAQYHKDYEKYKKDYESFKKQYEEEKKKMEDALKEYEKNKDKDGYLSSPYAKTLVYDSEPNAKLSLATDNGKFISSAAVDKAFSHDTDNYNKNLLQLDNMNVKYLENQGAFTNKAELFGNFGDKSGWKTNVSNNGVVKWSTVLLRRGQSVTATYTNLKNSYYNGKKISKIVFKYTLTNDSAFKNPNQTAWLGIFTDPTLGVFASAYTGENEKDTSIFVKNEFTFYDQDGKEIEFKDALLSVASLNREYNSIELAKDYTPGQFVRISGSSVDEDKTNKMVYATKSLNFKKGEGGARFSMYKREGESDSGWDSADATNSWYGAGAIKLQGPKNHITLGAASATKILQPPYGPIIQGKNNTDGKKPNIWYSLNGKIRAIGIPEIKAKEPEKPTPPVPPVEPKKPDTKVTYHYSVFYVKSKVEKKVYDAQGQDINEKVVKKDSVVDFTLNASDFPKGHEDIDSLVFKDTLPEDYDLDLDKTKAKSPDYDVSYDQNTRLLTFTAKASLLAEINKDKTKEAKVPSPMITGKVTKEGKTYENKFELKINNKYKVESNPVRVYTPTEPIKKVFKKGDTTTNIDGKRVEPGQELTYAIDYKNTTGKDVNVTITDKIPQYTTFVSADNNGQESGGVITWTAKVEKGKSLRVTFNVRVNKNVNGNILTNSAKVLDGTNTYTTNETKNPTPTEPKKEVFKENTNINIDGKRVEPGQVLTYAITYKNTTGEKVTATIKDKIPAHTSFVSAENGGVNNNGTVTWNVPVEKDKSVTVKFNVKVDEKVNGNTIKNDAKVFDGKNEYTTNEVTNPTPTGPKKEVFKTGTTTNIDGKRVEAGQVLDYAITYKNTTGEKVTATITDKIPEFTEFVSAEDGGTNNNGTVTWTKEVEKDKSVTVRFKVKVKADVNGDVVKNKAKVNDGKNNYDTNEVTNPTPTKPKKEVFKSGTTTNIDGKRVEAGQELTYSITYKNTTGEKVTATITDKIPEFTEFVSADNGGVNNNGTITWTKEVEKDKSITVTFKVRVKKDVNGDIVKNKAKVFDGKNEYDTNEVTNPTPTKPKKEVFKSGTTTNIDGKRVEAGEVLDYAITYKNTTGEKVTATITDKIPQFTEFVSAEDGGTNNNGTITWTKEVEKDKSVTVRFKVKVKADVNGELLKNKAKVNDGKNDYDTNEVTNPTPTKPKKEVFKSGTTTNIDGKRVEPGDELTYKITYTNTTGDNVKATITDKLPDFTEFVSAEDGGSHSNGIVKWTKDVDKGKSITVTFKVRVKKDVNGEIIKNKAKVNDGKNDYDTNEVTNPTPTGPKKDVFKSGTTISIDGKRVEAGQELTYAIDYKNTTGKDVDVTISDTIPAHTKFVSADNGGREIGGVVVWSLKVKSGKSVRVTFNVKVDEKVNGEIIKNKAKVFDGKNNYDTNEVTNPTPTKPKKEVFKSGTTTNIDGKRVEAGQELTYSITYKNTTGEKVTATIKDKIPEYTEFVSADNGGVNNNGTITWTKEVEKDKSLTVTFKVRVKKDVNGEVLKNKAKVNDGKNDYDTNEVTNPTPTKPKKEVFKSGTTTNIDGKRVEAGEELTYSITYKNTTGEKVTATIKDKIPEFTEFISADNGGVNNNGTITWTKEVEKDKSLTVTFKVRVKKDVNGEVLKNKAKVNDGKNDYDTNEVTNPTPTKPKKEVFKSGTTTNIDGKRVEAGEELTYSITYKNTTGEKVTATIKDKIPEYTEFVSADNGGVNNNGTITWTKEVEKDKSLTVTFKVRVKKDVNGEVLKNKAKVNDGKNDYDTNEVTNPTPTKPKKEVFKSGTQTNIDGKRVEAGQILDYAITYKNTTDDDVDATIKDRIPAHTKFVSAEDGGIFKDGIVTWTKRVAKGQSVTVRFKVKVDSDVNGEIIKNKAKVNDGKNDYDTNEVTNPTPTKPKKEVFKGTSKTNIDGKLVKAGEELTYKITYKNTTGEKVTATIKDKIPQFTEFVSADNGGTFKDGTVTWVKEVEKDKSLTVTLKVRVKKDVNGEVLKNKAKVNDGKNEYDTNEVTNPTPTKPKKEVFKSGTTTNIDGKKVKAGEELTYKITYKNTTGKEADVTITDKVPKYTKFISADNGGVYKGGVIKWRKTLKEGESWTVSFKVKVDEKVSGEVIKNVAKVRDGENEFTTNEVTNPTPVKPKKPKTGDDTNMMMLFMLLLGSFGAAVPVARRRRKNK